MGIDTRDNEKPAQENTKPFALARSEITHHDSATFGGTQLMKKHVLIYRVILFVVSFGGRGVNLHARYCLGLTDIIEDNPGDPVKTSVFQAIVNLSLITSV
jgi:hypothetical protein